MSTIIGSAQGSVLAVVHAGGAVDVYSIPENATITVQEARGFGSTNETSIGVSLSLAEDDINSQLLSNGAQ